MAVTDDDPDHIASVKKYPNEKFLMSDLGPLRYFLGIEITSTAVEIRYLRESTRWIYFLALD